MNEIDSFLKDLLGDYKKRMLPIKGRYGYTISYSKPTFSFPTIDIVIISPFIFDVNLNGYVKNEENCFYCLLYDKETDIIIGEIVRVYRDWDWKNEISFFAYTCENLISECECPICNFWLMQRVNKYGHKFLGCSGFPECDFSKEIGQ
jgi:hypothetical protein